MSTLRDGALQHLPYYTTLYCTVPVENVRTATIHQSVPAVRLSAVLTRPGFVTPCVSHLYGDVHSDPGGGHAGGVLTFCMPYPLYR